MSPSPPISASTSSSLALFAERSDMSTLLLGASISHPARRTPGTHTPSRFTLSEDPPPGSHIIPWMRQPSRYFLQQRPRMLLRNIYVSGSVASTHGVGRSRVRTTALAAIHDDGASALDVRDQRAHTLLYIAIHCRRWAELQPPASQKDKREAAEPTPRYERKDQHCPRPAAGSGRAAV